MAKRLARSPQVAEALQRGELTISQARKVAATVATLRRLVDRPDGLIDGQDGDSVVSNVIVDGVPQLVCEAMGAVSEDDPRLDALCVVWLR